MSLLHPRAHSQRSHRGAALNPANHQPLCDPEPRNAMSSLWIPSNPSTGSPTRSPQPGPTFWELPLHLPSSSSWAVLGPSLRTVTQSQLPPCRTHPGALCSTDGAFRVTQSINIDQAVCVPAPFPWVGRLPFRYQWVEKARGEGLSWAEVSCGIH